MTSEKLRPCHIDSLIINDDDEAPSLLNPFTGQILITNRVGKRVIELSDGTRTIDDIASKIASEFRGAIEATIVQHAETFLTLASQKGIITWTKQS